MTYPVVFSLMTQSTPCKWASIWLSQKLPSVFCESDTLSFLLIGQSLLFHIASFEPLPVTLLWWSMFQTSLTVWGVFAFLREVLTTYNFLNQRKTDFEQSSSYACQITLALWLIFDKPSPSSKFFIPWIISWVCRLKEQQIIQLETFILHGPSTSRNFLIELPQEKKEQWEQALSQNKTLNMRVLLAGLGAGALFFIHSFLAFNSLSAAATLSAPVIVLQTPFFVANAVMALAEVYYLGFHNANSTPLKLPNPIMQKESIFLLDSIQTVVPLLCWVLL